MEEMKVWEAELAFEGYRKKEYTEWLRTQRICYVLALVNSTKSSTITPNDIVDLSGFEDLFEDGSSEEKEETQTETREELLERIEKQTEQRKKAIGLV